MGFQLSDKCKYVHIQHIQFLLCIFFSVDKLTKFNLAKMFHLREIILWKTIWKFYTREL